MQTAEHILQAMHKMGEKRIPLTRVYRHLFSEDLFLAAYARLARNQGALTPGVDGDTVDGMSLKRIRKTIATLRYERYRFKPSRRVHIPKKSGGKRPIASPSFTDKLVQEALRMLLEAYYEPRFRESSHGFRPGRGCHTALARVRKKFVGKVWFVEGDIKGCFDNIDHEVLMGILSKDIKDGRLLNLIRMALKAGYMEDWVYHKTYSGTPQGGVLSPLLSNIYLHELDVFIEDELTPQYTRGKKRATNPEYNRYTSLLKCARQDGDMERVRQLERERRQYPSLDTHDPNYRRLAYVRYADDFILGFTGPKLEANAITEAIGEFLRERLHLELSTDKTLITHGRTQQARFLSYSISIYDADDKLSDKTNARTKVRSANGRVRLGIPQGLIREHVRRYQRRGKVVDEKWLVDFSDPQIILTFQMRFRGLAEYYKYAVDRYRLGSLKHAMEIALVKTLARKHKTSVRKIYRKHRATRTVKGFEYKVLQVEVPTSKGTRTIYWGAVPLRVVRPGSEPVNDRRYQDMFGRRTDLIRRMQTDRCELCGSHENIEVHHIRRMADLNRPGRKAKPVWMQRMIALRRKTLVVCRRCHKTIHAGKPTPNKMHISSGEPDDAKVSRPVRRGVYGKVPTQ
jgi:group II intron reverse transcriptase/maturase